MVEYPVQIGRIAMSTAGRDKGRYFVIMDIIDAQYVYIVDGDLRTKDRPKKKKLRHLKLCPEVLDGLPQKLRREQGYSMQRSAVRSDHARAIKTHKRGKQLV